MHDTYILNFVHLFVIPSKQKHKDCKNIDNEIKMNILGSDRIVVEVHTHVTYRRRDRPVFTIITVVQIHKYLN